MEIKLTQFLYEAASPSTVESIRQWVIAKMHEAYGNRILDDKLESIEVSFDEFSSLIIRLYPEHLNHIVQFSF